MTTINVLVVTTSPDLKAEGIAAAVAGRVDMTLICDRIVNTVEIGELLAGSRTHAPIALVLVGAHSETEELATRWMRQRSDLVVLLVDIVNDVVRIAMRDVGLDPLLTALRELVDRAGTTPWARVSRFRMPPQSLHPMASPEPEPNGGSEQTILHAAVDWLHAVLRNAVGRTAGGNGDLPGLTVTPETVSGLLDARPARSAHREYPDVLSADAVLMRAIADAQGRVEPLARLIRNLDLTPLEFRLLVLGLGPELDPRYQRCLGMLLDDLGRRVGTLALYAELLGESTEVRCRLAKSGGMTRWRVFEGSQAGFPGADEPLRVDPPLREWLLGSETALENDPRARRVMRREAWTGAVLLHRDRERAEAVKLVSRLLQPADVRCIALVGDNGAVWRAMFELASAELRTDPIRVDASSLANLDPLEIEESGLRLARMARLQQRPLVIDASAFTDDAEQSERLRALLAAVGNGSAPVALIATSVTPIVRLLGPRSYDLMPVPRSVAHVAVVTEAAKGADAFLTPESAQTIATQYPLRVDGFEQAMWLARTMPLVGDAQDPGSERFLAACKEVSAVGTSMLAERIEPSFELDDIVLPGDRRQQLDEIVDNIRFADKVLDGWKFRRLLPYGRGVTALFHGPSGTGKTMAALGVARKLGVQVLRIDLSRVVSKYIGDTEKNIDRVFKDAQASGAALLIDEADALFGKRSEVRDAHDRYANIEVAYLLQRMELHEGLAILTTNLRQNLDQAFVRRLRFIVDFPKPDASAREKIWRRCLPKESHLLDDAAFRQLARRVELTGGHIRQITLRAAFMAAANDVEIGLRHVAAATRSEFAKLGMQAVEIDIAERGLAA